MLITGDSKGLIQLLLTVNTLLNLFKTKLQIQYKTHLIFLPDSGIFTFTSRHQIYHYTKKESIQLA